jgi:DNA-binding transcriptional ArsR family regulator
VPFDRHRYFEHYRKIDEGAATLTATSRQAVDVARVFRALGDPTRLAIFEAVRSATENCTSCSSSEIQNSVSEIAAQFDLALSTVSHHLRELRLAGLIRCERQGQQIRCVVSPEVLDAAGRFLNPKA